MSQIDDKSEGALQQAARATRASTEPAGSLGHSAGIANAAEQFKRLLGKAARTFAEAELFNGNPADWSHSFEDYKMNAATKARFDDAKQSALVELIMFAKVRGDEVIAQGMAARSGETGTGSTEGNSPVACDAPNPHQGGHNEGTH